MIRHSVVFRLRHAPGSRDEALFLANAGELREIPGVLNFRILRQTSSKNPFTHGIEMEFENDADYAAYNDHPAHVAFVTTRWLPEVAEFMEIDFAPLG